MHITNSDVIHFCCSFFGGSGLGFLAIKLFIQKEAEKVLKPVLEKIEKDIEKIQDEYVTCKFCDATRESVQSTLFEINKKLDLLIEHAIVKN